MDVDEIKLMLATITESSKTNTEVITASIKNLETKLYNRLNALEENVNEHIVHHNDETIKIKNYIDQHIGSIEDEVHILANDSTDRNVEDIRRDKEIEELKQKIINMERATYSSIQHG